MYQILVGDVKSSCSMPVRRPSLTGRDLEGLGLRDVPGTSSQPELGFRVWVDQASQRNLAQTGWDHGRSFIS